MKKLIFIVILISISFITESCFEYKYPKLFENTTVEIKYQLCQERDTILIEKYTKIYLDNGDLKII